MVYDQRKFFCMGQEIEHRDMIDICIDYINAFIHCSDKMRQYLHFEMSKNILLKNNILPEKNHMITLHGIISEKLTDNLDKEINLPEFPSCENTKMYAARLVKKLDEYEKDFLTRMFEIECTKKSN